MSNTGDGEPGTMGILSADMVMEAVSEIYVNTNLPGYEYDTVSGYYYNPETRYFYDMKTSMYFHQDTQTWYSYDSSTGSYVAHGNGASFQPGKWSKKRFRRRTAGLFGKEAVTNSFDQTNVDLCELLYDLVDKCDLGSQRAPPARKSYFERFEEHDDESPAILGEPSVQREDIPNTRTYYDSDDSYDSDDLAVARENERQNPPCIRLIEASNDNQLHIVTMMGAMLGSDVKCDVPLPQDDNYVAKKHIHFKYIEEMEDGASGYSVECLGKWALLNGQYIESGHCYRVDHEDTLQIGNNHFIVHIHHGNNTCRGCEPGLLSSSQNKASVSQPPQKSREAQRLENLRQMKNEYGLSLRDSDYRTSKNYSDRSRHRRETVGSDIPITPSSSSGMYRNCSARPVEGATVDSVVLKTKPPKCEEPLSTSNKGFKLLKGMGWKEGTGLGKNEQGIVGPVVAAVQKDRQGLGNKKISAEAPVSKKQRMLDVTRKRFEEASAKGVQKDL